MATYRKRGKKWQVQVRKKDNKAISKTFHSKSDAEIWAKHMELEIDKGELPILFTQAKNKTLRELIERYLAEVTPTKRSATIEAYRLNKMLRNDFVDLPLSKIKSKHIAQYRDERLLEVGNQAVKHDLNVLGHIFNTAIKEWSIPLKENPVVNVKKPKLPQSRDRRVSSEELRTLREQADTLAPLHVLNVIYFAIETAMRRGEILSLSWDKINWDKCTLHIATTKNGHPRTIPLSHKAIDILKEHKAAQHEKPFPVTAGTFKYYWDRIVQRASIENLHFHDLRHEGISRLFEKGLSVPEVALISGHKDFRILSRYTHMRAENIVGKLDKSK